MAESSTRPIGGPRPPAIANRDDRGHEETESHDAKRAVCRPAMPLEISGRAAGGRDNVDVGCARREKKGNRRRSSASAERRTRQRQAEQAVRQVVQST